MTFAFWALAGWLASVPAPFECANMNIAPVTPPEPLEIVSDGKPIARYKVEIAANPAAREQGLMCRPALAEDAGMLFEYPQAGPHSFWMHNTLIGLDIIYIGADGRILSIQKNAKPLDDTPLPSLGSAQAVLEVPAGQSDKYDFKPGDAIIHRFFGTH